MRIILHDTVWRSPFSVLASLVTGHSVSHASIEHKGEIYDTNWQRGYFAKRELSDLQKESERVVTIFHIPLDAQGWIEAHLEKKTRYNKLGLLFWVFDSILPKTSKMYCFEVVSNLLRSHGFDIRGGKVSGRTILFDLCNKYGLKGRRMLTRQLLFELSNNQ